MNRLLVCANETTGIMPVVKRTANMKYFSFKGKQLLIKLQILNSKVMLNFLSGGIIGVNVSDLLLLTFWLN